MINDNNIWYNSKIIAQQMAGNVKTDKSRV